MKCPSFPKGAAKLEESEEQNDRKFPKTEKKTPTSFLAVLEK